MERTSKDAIPAIVIHGGAGKFLGSSLKEERARESLQRICHEAFAKLTNGVSAIDAVVWAVSQLEDDPQFNAGTGGKLQRDGVARLSAALMDGEHSRFAGVSLIEGVQNPIQIVKLLLEEKDRVLGAEGAKAFARAQGFASYNPVTEATWSEWKEKSEKGIRQPSEELFGTVGAVAVDLNGRLAAATSTGGKGMELPGRVSDSATCAGTFATREVACSATGVGEEIVEHALTARIATRVVDGATFLQAFEKTFKELRESKARAGVIGVNKKGEVQIQTTTECILHAFENSNGRGGYPA